jgi:hypothetical protein
MMSVESHVIQSTNVRIVRQVLTLSVSISSTVSGISRPLRMLQLLLRLAAEEPHQCVAEATTGRAVDEEVDGTAEEHAQYQDVSCEFHIRHLNAHRSCDDVHAEYDGHRKFD